MPLLSQPPSPTLTYLALALTSFSHPKEGTSGDETSMTQHNPTQLTWKKHVRSHE